MNKTLKLADRQIIETSLEQGLSHMSICKKLGISTYDLHKELDNGWVVKTFYSAQKAQENSKRGRKKEHEKIN